MLRTITLAVALQLGLGATVMACEGQTGAVIFEDTFADDSGGWEMTPPQAVIVPPTMLLALDSQFEAISAQNLTFNATDGDYCATIKLPPQPAPDNDLAFGIQFWASDYSNVMSFMVFTNKSVGLYKKVDNAWSTVFNQTDVAAVDTTAGAVNEIRVQAKAGMLKLLVNGTEIKSVRAQVPAGALRFGVYAQIDTPVEPPPAIVVTSFKVTEAQ